MRVDITSSRPHAYLPKSDHSQSAESSLLALPPGGRLCSAAAGTARFSGRFEMSLLKACFVGTRVPRSEPRPVAIGGLQRDGSRRMAVASSQARTPSNGESADAASEYDARVVDVRAPIGALDDAVASPFVGGYQLMGRFGGIKRDGGGAQGDRPVLRRIE